MTTLEEYRRHIGGFHALVDWLTAPLVVNADYETRLKSQWLASLFLIVVPLAMLFRIYSYFTRPVWQASEIIAPVGLLVCFTVLYLLSRLGRYKLAAGLAVGLSMFIITVTVVLEPSVRSKPSEAALLLMPVLFTSIIFGRKTTILITIASFVGTFSLPLFWPRLSVQDVLVGPCMMLFVGGSLSLFGTWLRDLLEAQHTEVLKAANEALQSEIAERKRVQQQVLSLALEREKAQLLQDFISDMSHDLMTPLTVIQSTGYVSEKLMDQLLSKAAALETTTADNPALHGQVQALAHDGVEIRDRCLRTEESAQRLQSLIKRLIEMVEVDNQVTYDLEPVDLNRLVLETLQSQQRAATCAGLQVEVDLESHLPVLRLDEFEIRRVIDHLLANALANTPAGGSVRLRTNRSDQQVVLEVQDTGIGIPANDLPHIFERFYRVDTARATNSGGSGLGLAIAKKIVAAHRGEILAESTPGSGSTFKVLLPIEA